jgi:hypothetical protein
MGNILKIGYPEYPGRRISPASLSKLSLSDLMGNPEGG